VTNVPRITELKQVAVEAQETIQETDENRETNQDDLLADDELESLF